jgi:hypothetical protein
MVQYSKSYQGNSLEEMQIDHSQLIGSLHTMPVDQYRMTSETLCMEQTIPIYCYLGQEPVTLSVNKSLSAKDIAQECLKLRKAEDTRRIPRLYNSQGSIIPIGPNIPPNTADRRYRLQFCDAQEFKAVRQDEMQKLQKDLEAISRNIEVQKINHSGFINFHILQRNRTN